MSNTPRTDEALEDSAFENKNHPHTDWVLASFARQLERENAELKRRLDEVTLEIRDDAEDADFVRDSLLMVHTIERVRKCLGFSQLW